MNYFDLSQKIEKYKQNFNVKEIGTSYFGRKIFAVEKITKENLPTAIFLCSVHAREHITTDLVCKMIDENLFQKISGFNLSFILMANPDGVMISYDGISSVPTEFQEKLKEMAPADFDFRLWKANGRGVDINNNFDAGFGQNVHSRIPAPWGFVGDCPSSEPETRAIQYYTKMVKPFFTISYHSKGEEIYYNYFQDGAREKRDKLIAEKFAKSTGYLIKNPEKTSSGGYKDYCIEKLKIPALTIEIGNDKLFHPILSDHLDEIFERHKNVANDLNFAYNVFKEFERNYGISRKIYENGNKKSKKSL